MYRELADLPNQHVVQYLSRLAVGTQGHQLNPSIHLLHHPPYKILSHRKVFELSFVRYFCASLPLPGARSQSLQEERAAKVPRLRDRGPSEQNRIKFKSMLLYELTTSPSSTTFSPRIRYTPRRISA
jgi:hypothetical protein